jgi:hypothetical protein
MEKWLISKAQGQLFQAFLKDAMEPFRDQRNETGSSIYTKATKKNSMGLSPQANYTD